LTKRFCLVKGEIIQLLRGATLIQAHLQAPQRDTSISPTGNVRPTVGPFRAALRRPYYSGLRGRLTPSLPRCDETDL